MRKILLSLTLLCATALSAAAQNSASTMGQKTSYSSFYSIRAGVNFSNYMNSRYDSDCQTGFNVAGLYNFSLMADAPLYLQTGVGVEMKGAQNNLILEGPEKSHFKSYGVQVPLLVTYELPVGKYTAIVPELGLFYSFAFRGEMEYGGEYSRPYEKLEYTLFDGEEVDARMLHRSDFGIRAGLSFRYSRCLIGFAYDAGLINSFTEDFRDLGAKMSSGSWSVNLGYRFN